MRYLLGLFLILSIGLPGVLSAEQIALTPSFTDRPLVYEKTLFGLRTDEQFSKVNLSGQSLWNISDISEAIRAYDIHFDRLFLVDDQGRLLVYDAEYGYRLWRKTNLEIEKIVLGYPWAYYLNESGKMGCLDFLSGQSIWEYADQAFLDIIPLGKGTYVAGLTRTHLHLLSSVTGERLHRIKLPKPGLKALSNWNRGLALSDGQSIYVFNLEALAFSKSKQGILPQSSVVNQKYYVSVSDDGHIKSYDLENKLEHWTAALEKDVQGVVFSRDEVAVQVTGNQLLFIDHSTGDTDESHLPIVADSFDYDTFFTQDTLLYFVSKSSILTIDKDQ